MVDFKKCNPGALEDLAKRLASSLPDNLQHFKHDIEKNFQSILQSTFHKLDLVTREEFDAQVAVLERSRIKLAELEKHIAELEKKLGKKTQK